MDGYIEKEVCDFCDKEFEYNTKDEMERWDYDYEENHFIYWVVNCPLCGEMTRVRG